MSNSTLFHNAALILEDGNCLMNRNLYVVDGKIAKIVETAADDGAISADETIDCSEYYLSCGIPSLHTHMAMNIYKGIAEDVTPDAWFNEMIFPYESKVTEQDIYLGTKLAAAELINNGVTVVADHYFGEEAVLRAIKDTGIRGDISPTLFGSAPDYKDRLAQVTSFIKTHKNDSDRVSFRMGPHADYTCPPDTLEEMVAIAKDLDVPMHIHLEDDKKQTDISREKYGRTPCKVLSDCGLLDRPILFGHGLWIEPEDLELINDNCWFGFVCKTYMKLGSERGNFFRFHKQLQFGFGTDGAASSNTLNPVEQARLFALEGKFPNLPEEFDTTYVWKRLMSGHKAFSFGSGHLQEGAPADLVVWDLKTPDTFPIYHPITSILYSSNSSNVRYTMVAGEFLKYDGKLKMDFTSLRIEAEEAQRALLARGKGKANVSFLR